MEVHFSQRLIFGEWSWSLHRATEKPAMVTIYKAKTREKSGLKKDPPRSLGALNQ